MSGTRFTRRGFSAALGASALQRVAAKLGIDLEMEEARAIDAASASDPAIVDRIARADLVHLLGEGGRVLRGIHLHLGVGADQPLQDGLGLRLGEAEALLQPLPRCGRRVGLADELDVQGHIPVDVVRHERNCGLAAAIRAMQVYVVECLQRRLFVRGGGVHHRHHSPGGVGP